MRSFGLCHHLKKDKQISSGTCIKMKKKAKQTFVTSPGILWILLIKETLQTSVNHPDGIPKFSQTKLNVEGKKELSTAQTWMQPKILLFQENLLIVTVES